MKKLVIPRHVHFVGIGGIGNSSLAQHLLQKGCHVSGSDKTENDSTRLLRGLGASVTVGHDKSNVVGARLVVKTSAVADDNCEITYARKHKIPVILREQLLGKIFDGYSTRIAVCGTHGKTTITAMICHVLNYCKLGCTCFIGGYYHGNNYHNNGSNVVVAEACEYNRSFLNLHPTITVCSNVEYDHPDCYANVEEVQNAFCSLFEQSEYNVVNAHCSRFVGKTQNISYYNNCVVTNVKTNKNGCCSFETIIDGVCYNVQLNVAGRHNVDNALATIAVCKKLGIPVYKVITALDSFDGVERRWTNKTTQKGYLVVSDYAHHPTEILCAVDTAKSIAKGKVLCVFQPHTYSRTKAYLNSFVTCFAKADEVIYLPIFSAREQPIEGIDSQLLTNLAIQQKINGYFAQDFAQAVKLVTNSANSGDVVLLLGAGDIEQMYGMLK